MSKKSQKSPDKLAKTEKGVALSESQLGQAAGGTIPRWKITFGP